MGQAQDGLGAGQQLDVAEGFGDVVVGPHLQSLDDVHLRVANRQYEDGDVREGTDLPADLVAIHVGQSQVEDNDVGSLSLHELNALGAGVGHHRLRVAPSQLEA